METLAVSRAVQCLNDEFKDDPKNLHKAKQLFEEASKERSRLQGQLSFASSEVPGQLETAVAEAEKCTGGITRFQAAHELLSGDVTYHRADVADVIKVLTSLKGQIEELEKYSCYLRCVSRIEELSSDIQSALIIDVAERAVKQFSALAELTETLQASKCKNLVHYANQTLLFWYNILRDKLASEFEQVLLAWRWPFIVTSLKQKPVANQAELKEKLPSLFTSLLALQLPMSLSGEQTSKHAVLSDTELRPMLLPIQLMLKPLGKRFRYHFYGSKQTNSLDKPEWYYTQVLTWLRDHREFLQKKIQPLLNNASLKYVDVMAEFTRGLVLLVMEKMLCDVPELLYDDQTFCHFVDETLSFQRELTDAYAYPASQPSCLQVLVQPDCFTKWLLIERKFAMERMDGMLSDARAWQSPYAGLGAGGGGEVDELHVPQCGESFVTLVSTMTERYRALPTAAHRSQFLALQLDVLEEYRVRLAQVKNAEALSPLSSGYAAILNTVSYVLDVLTEWSDLPFFMELHLYRERQEESMYSAVGEQPSAQETLMLSAVGQADVSLSRDLDKSAIESLEGAVFDQLIALYGHFRKEMLGSLIKYLFDDVTARSRPYRKDKWLALPSQKAYVSPALSTTACEMLMVLREHLHHAGALLATPLFELAWADVARRMNAFVYNDVILDNRFNEGGAAQLQYDMLRNLFPLFAQYTSKPENYFKDVKEACLLLTLPSGSAKLLNEVLYQALGEAHTDRHAKVTDPIATLHEMGVYKLSLEECQLVLSRRTDL